MADIREVTEGIQHQGKDESIQYTVTVSPAPQVGSTPTVYVFDEAAPDTDAKATHMPVGSVSFAGSVITLPNLTALVLNHTYRVEIRYTDGTNTLEPFFRVQCDR